MTNEKIITIIALLLLGICFFALNGCEGGKEIVDSYQQMNEWNKTLEEVYVIETIGELSDTSTCLSCIGCVNMKSNCMSNAGYYGCIDCFGVTINEEDYTLEDLFAEQKIFGGLCGTSCLSCYLVKIPLPDSNWGIKPAYGCMTGE